VASKNRKTLTIHADARLLARVDAIVKQHTFANRHSIHRLAIMAGLERMESDPTLVDNLAARAANNNG
jgi:hypothetical protein